MEKSIEKIIQNAIDRKIFPGCVVGIVKRGGERVILPFGRFTYDNASAPMKENSIFDVASITKSIPTSSLVLRLIEGGKLSLEDRLIDFVPEFNNSYRDQVLIKHLLTYTLNYNLKVGLSDLKDKGPDEILRVIFNTELKSKPGTEFLYTNATAILLGLVAERVAGDTVDVMAETHFFKPLGMIRTSFHPDRFDCQEIVPTEFDDWRGRIIQGEIHDESAFVLRQKMIAGSAGLFSTVPDLLNFLEMLLGEGEYQNKKFFSKDIISKMYTNQLEHIGKSAGLGWELNQLQYMGTYSTQHTFGKTGFTGCVCVIDIIRGVAAVLLSNYTFPKRKPTSELINEVRRAVMETVFEGL